MKEAAKSIRRGWEIDVFIFQRPIFIEPSAILADEMSFVFEHDHDFD